MSDLISRQAVIEAIDAVFPADPMRSEYAQGIACGAALAKTYIEQLPSAQPEIETKTGRWIDYYGEVEIYNAGGFTETRKIGVKCSVCQWINRWYAGNYCGNCGAKMEVEET